MSEPRSLPSAARGVALLGTPVHYVRAGTEALGELEPEHFAAHRRRLGARPDLRGRAGAAFLDRLDDTSLTGRGGGHYPTATKWPISVCSGVRIVLVSEPTVITSL